DRPPDAGAVAAAVAAYRTGVEHRLRKAEVERAEAAVRDSERGKRRRGPPGPAGAGPPLVLGGGGGAWVHKPHARGRQGPKLREEALDWEAINARLGEAEAALRADDLATADAALALVPTWLRPHTPAHLRNRYAAIVRDRDMAAALESLTDLQRSARTPEGEL